MRAKLALLFSAAMLLCACASTPQKPLATVPNVEVLRYMGKWHEIARLPITAPVNQGAAIS